MDIKTLKKINNFLSIVLIYVFVMFVCAFLDSRDVSKEQWEDNFSSIMNASEQYIEEHNGEYPTDINQLFVYTDFLGNSEIEGQFFLEDKTVSSRFIPKGRYLFISRKKVFEKTFSIESEIRVINTVSFSWSEYKAHEGAPEAHVDFIKFLELSPPPEVFSDDIILSSIFILPTLKVASSVTLARKKKESKNIPKINYFYDQPSFSKRKPVSIQEKYLNIEKEIFKIENRNKILNIIMISFSLFFLYIFTDIGFSRIVSEEENQWSRDFIFLVGASEKYIEEHDGEYPTDINQLLSYTNFWSNSEIENNFSIDENIISSTFFPDRIPLLINEVRIHERTFDLESKKYDNKRFTWSEHMAHEGYFIIFVIFMKILETISKVFSATVDLFIPIITFFSFMRIAPLLIRLIYKDYLARKIRL